VRRARSLSASNQRALVLDCVRDPGDPVEELTL
jgi:hypothetical protein